MKIRLAKKIMKRCNGSSRYIGMILLGLDVSKELPKIKQYWEPRWVLYFAYGNHRCGRKDHRITKAKVLSSRKNKRRL